MKEDLPLKLSCPLDQMFLGQVVINVFSANGKIKILIGIIGKRDGSYQGKVSQLSVTG